MDLEACPNERELPASTTSHLPRASKVCHRQIRYIRRTHFGVQGAPFLRVANSWRVVASTTRWVSAGQP